MSHTEYTLAQRHELARRLHLEGYNCAQCVAKAFPDVTDGRISDEALSIVMAPFGGGLGQSGEVCGAISGMAAVNSLATYLTPADKRKVYGDTHTLVDEFRNLNGCVTCRELRRPGAKPCMQLIEDAITILHNRLEDTHEA